MSLLTNVHAENKSERRLSVFIFNLIIFVMSCIILATYATQPFFKVRANANLTEEKVAEFIQLEGQEIDVNTLVNNGVTLDLEVVVSAEVALDTAANVLNRILFHFDTNVDLNDTITKLVDDNVDSLVNQFTSTFENIVESLPESVEDKDAAMAELKLNARNKILSLLGENVHEKVASGLKFASTLLIFSMATWIYLMIKILVKLFRKDNTVKFRVPILFGGLPGFLWLIPSIVLHFLSKNPETLANPYNLALSFFASGWVAILGALVLIIISAPYATLRKALKGNKLKKFK